MRTVNRIIVVAGIGFFLLDLSTYVVPEWPYTLLSIVAFVVLALLLIVTTILGFAHGGALLVCG